jgi:hypothetical protein
VRPTGPVEDGTARTDESSMLGTRAARLPDCRPLLADPDDLTLGFQPIVDLAAVPSLPPDTLLTVNVRLRNNVRRRKDPCGG